MTVGKRIKEYRSAKGWTQKKLAEESGVAAITIRQYENESRTPKTEKLQQIAVVLGVSINTLLGISTEQLLQPSKDETIFLNYLSSIGIEYIPDINNPYPEYDKADRGIYWKSENITIPLTKEEYEIFRKNIQEDVEKELQRIRQYKRI